MGLVSQVGPILVRPGDLTYEPLGIEGATLAETGAAVGPGQSQTLGCGFARFEACAFRWKLSYDETVYVIEGALEVRRDGELLAAGPGDVVFVPRGSSVEYRIPGRCVLFYATYPVDWAAAQSAQQDEDGQ